ncbi:hypothetical protein B9Z55_018863 [Caenorhabditis nigoni]|uniref:UPAR/Ly6 domain-containing protein n=1 Tax=Caenorhabditis nigoni TaxID=1611254 RepID=A0A2G5TGN8_9PELO|nr:hypothetical protein B9Z55_018863 [Caenorhabditis nigoni]
MQNVQRKFLKGLLLQVLIPYSALVLPAGLGLILLLMINDWDQKFVQPGLCLIATHGLLSTMTTILVHKPYRLHLLILCRRFFFLPAGSVIALICENCDGSTCYEKDRWIQESCPPSAQFCYRLSSKGQAFRRGCSDFPCDTLPGFETNMECRTCSQDRCNNERDSFFHQRGGGVSWKNAASRDVSSTSILGTLLIFLTSYL